MNEELIKKRSGVLRFRCRKAITINVSDYDLYIQIWEPTNTFINSLIHLFIHLWLTCQLTVSTNYISFMWIWVLMLSDCFLFCCFEIWSLRWKAVAAFFLIPGLPSSTTWRADNEKTRAFFVLFPSWVCYIFWFFFYWRLIYFFYQMRLIYLFQIFFLSEYLFQTLVDSSIYFF